MRVRDGKRLDQLFPRGLILAHHKQRPHTEQRRVHVGRAVFRRPGRQVADPSNARSTGREKLIERPQSVFGIQPLIGAQNIFPHALVAGVHARDHPKRIRGKPHAVLTVGIARTAYQVRSFVPPAVQNSAPRAFAYEGVFRKPALETFLHFRRGKRFLFVRFREYLAHFGHIVIELKGRHDGHARAKFFRAVGAHPHAVQSVVPIAVQRMQTICLFVYVGDEKARNAHEVFENGRYFVGFLDSLFETVIGVLFILFRPCNLFDIRITLFNCCLKVFLSLIIINLAL